MKPFIFEFKELPTETNVDYSQVEYDPSLNLSIHRQTGLPAIESVNLETDTFTKTEGEGADTDKNGLQMLVETQTVTLVNSEATDSDKDRFLLKQLVDTTTATRTTAEATDQDR